VVDCFNCLRIHPLVLTEDSLLNENISCHNGPLTIQNEK